MRPIVTFIIFILSFFIRYEASAQIDFSEYSSLYTIEIFDETPLQDLDFGFVTTQSTVAISLDQAKILRLYGVEYLDVTVSVMADLALTEKNGASCAGSLPCEIPFTLKAAYNNRGTSIPGQSVLINIPQGTNIGSVRFPIKYRGSGPPGPPPTPVYEGYNPDLFKESAYLFIYGDINVGQVAAGEYEGTITVVINYD